MPSPLYLNVYKLPDGQSHQPTAPLMNRDNANTRFRYVEKATRGTTRLAYRVKVTLKEPSRATRSAWAEGMYANMLGVPRIRRER
jgi:hypothetical protein